MLKQRTIRNRKNRLEKGLTLIEVMIVIAILGLLATVVVVNVVGQLDDAKVDVADAKLTQIQNAVTAYRIKNGSPNDLKQLLNPKRGTPLIKKEQDLLDPWDNEIIYKKGKRNSYTLISKGPDGQIGTEDDIKKEN